MATIKRQSDKKSKKGNSKLSEFKRLKASHPKIKGRTAAQLKENISMCHAIDAGMKTETVSESAVMKALNES